jgi:hypothetical protein
VDAATVAGRQIDLRRQYVPQRRAERAHVGHERPLCLGSLGREQIRHRQRDACHRGGF